MGKIFVIAVFFVVKYQRDGGIIDDIDTVYCVGGEWACLWTGSRMKSVVGNGNKEIVLETFFVPSALRMTIPILVTGVSRANHIVWMVA